MVRATWKGAVLAESERTIVVEGNHYFPPASLRREYLRPSRTHTFCIWKGKASYYTVVVDGDENRDAAWYYPEPLSAADHLRGRVAFWRGVRVEEIRPGGGEEEKDEAGEAVIASRWVRLRRILTS